MRHGWPSWQRPELTQKAILSEGWPAEHGRPCGEIPGVKGEGGFVGGARSPRPQKGAECKARHNMIIEGQSSTPWPNGGMPRRSPSFPRGRAEPALPRGGQPGKGGLVGKLGEKVKWGSLGGEGGLAPQM